jgi:hypothetical protein
MYRSLPKAVLLPLLLCALLCLSQLAIAQDDDVAEAANSQRALSKYERDRFIRGPASFKALQKKDKAKVDRVAASNGKTSEELEEEIQNDADLAIDPDAEALVYVCEGLSADEHAAEVNVAALGQTSAFPEADDPLIAHAFLLHSRPGASKMIYLDFNGKPRSYETLRASVLPSYLPRTSADSCCKLMHGSIGMY